MREFDINNIGTKMPYKAPSDDFFDKFTEDILAKVEPPKRRITSIRRLTSVCGIAAAVVVMLMIVFDLSPNHNANIDEYTTSESIAESFDSYLANLSDEEFDQLFTESACQDDFYLNLPYN